MSFRDHSGGEEWASLLNGGIAGFNFRVQFICLRHDAAALSEIDLADLERKIRDALIDREFFVAGTVSVPDLKSLPRDDEIDHSRHEYEGLEFTNEPCDDQAKRDIETFISSFNLLKKF